MTGRERHGFKGRIGIAAALAGLLSCAAPAAVAQSQALDALGHCPPEDEVIVSVSLPALGYLVCVFESPAA